MSFNYKIADDEIIDLANEIIKKHHSDLEDENIAYIVKYDTWAKNGKIILGSAKKCSEKETLLTGYTFIITLNSLVLTMPANTIKAVIDHELSHCGVEKDEHGNKQRFIIEHDLEDFSHIIQRYGMYTDDVEYFMQAVKQISLFDDDRNLKVAR